MITVTIYQKSNCQECLQAVAELKSLEEIIPHHTVVINLEEHPELQSAVGPNLPVVEVGPYRLKSPFSKSDLQATLGAARDRAEHFQAVGDTRYQQRVDRGQSITGADRFSSWFSSRYMLVFNLIFLVYSGLPVLAPVFMKAGLSGLGKLIYAIYSPLCHQLAYRSWFFFGAQPAYPRALAGVIGLQTFEQVTGINPLDLNASRALIGNSALGYKMAICERDIAIYAAILLFGVIFSATGLRLKSLPWYAWIAIGILPIAVDGFSQLPSLLNYPWLNSFPMRESTPLLRTITGFLFGFTTAWFGYPYIEETMRDTRLLMARKLAIANSADHGLHTGKA